MTPCARGCAWCSRLSHAIFLGISVSFEVALVCLTSVSGCLAAKRALSVAWCICHFDAMSMSLVNCH